MAILVLYPTRIKRPSNLAGTLTASFFGLTSSSCFICEVRATSAANIPEHKQQEPTVDTCILPHLFCNLDFDWTLC